MVYAIKFTPTGRADVHDLRLPVEVEREFHLKLVDVLTQPSALQAVVRVTREGNDVLEYSPTIQESPTRWHQFLIRMKFYDETFHILSVDHFLPIVE